MTTWDNSFEASPADSDGEKYGASKIRELKSAVNERMIVEHDWRATGKHSPGLVSTVYEGTATQINALTGMSAGALAFNTDTGQWMRYSGSSWLAHSSILTAAAGGTVDAITATFSPTLTALSNNTRIIVITIGANTLVNPTFSPNGLTVKEIVKGSNQALIPGDIPGASFPAILQYNSVLDKWVLINPAYAVSSITPPVGAIVAWHKSFTNTPSLSYGWVECNGQVLSDAGSVYNGQTIPDLNGGGRFLRGSAASGTMQAEDIGPHLHTINIPKGYNRESSSRFVRGADNEGTTQLSTNDSTGTETRPINMSVVWIMRVK